MSSTTKDVAGAILGLLALTPAGGWLGGSGCSADRPSSEALAPLSPPTPSVSLTSTASTPVVQLTANFDVQLAVYPAQAQILLDGREVGRGRLALQLPRDGRTHELRIRAEGYVPERLVFADASPPREITLQAAGKPAQSAPSAESIVAPATRAPVRHVRTRFTSLPPYPRNEPATAPAAELPSALAASADARREVPVEKPSIQIIEPEAPKIRVVE